VLLLIDALERHDPTELEECETPVLINLYTLLSYGRLQVISGIHRTARRITGKKLQPTVSVAIFGDEEFVQGCRSDPWFSHDLETQLAC
jgi:sulfur transfer protein SufE